MNFEKKKKEKKSKFKIWTENWIRVLNSIFLKVWKKI
jgi:hypothetical protein